MKASYKVSLVAILAMSLALVMILGASMGSAAAPDPQLTNDLVFVGNGAGGVDPIKVVDIDAMAMVNAVGSGGGINSNHGIQISGDGRYIYTANAALNGGRYQAVKFDLGTLADAAVYTDAAARVYGATTGLCGIEFDQNNTSGNLWVTSMTAAAGDGGGGLYEVSPTTGFTGGYVDSGTGADNRATCGIGWNASGSLAYTSLMNVKKTNEMSWPGAVLTGGTATHSATIHILDTNKTLGLVYVAGGNGSGVGSSIDVVDMATNTVVGAAATQYMNPHSATLAHGNGFLYSHSRPTALNGSIGYLLVFDTGGGTAGGTPTNPVQIAAIPDGANGGGSCGNDVVSKSDYCGSPSLTTTKTAAYWASPTDQANGRLSVDYDISNTGSIHVNTVSVTGAVNSNGVTTDTTLPASVSNIAAGESASVTIKYMIPGGVTSFTSNLDVSTKDLCNTTAVLASGAVAVDIPATKNYYFTWYDSDPAWGMNGDWILVSNKDATVNADVNIYIGDISEGATPVATFSNIAPGGHVEWMSPTPLTNGAVRVASVNGQELVVSQRALYKSSFNEVQAVEYTNLDSEYHFPWYDNTAEWGMMGDWICVTNLGSVTTNVDVSIGGSLATTMTIPAGGHSEWMSPTPVNNGPVKVTSTNTQPLLVSQRVIYKQSFNEVMGIPASKLAAEAWFTWYDNNAAWGMNGDWVIIANTGASAANVEITVDGTLVDTLAIPAGGHNEWTSPVTLTNGPVKVKDTNGQPLVIGRRVLFMDSFDEIQGTYTGDLPTTASFNWYDNNPAWGMREDWICVTNTGAVETNVEIYIDSIQRTTMTIPAGGHAEWFMPTTLTSGPVRLISTNGQDILVSQRVLYKNSFNELVGERWA